MLAKRPCRWSGVETVSMRPRRSTDPSVADRQVAPGHGWRTTQDRTRLLVTYLWDGRCGHCNGPLVRVRELGIEPLPLDVDHAHPSVNGGPDGLMNYIASCARCNRKRQATWLRADHTIRSLLRTRRTLLDEFDDHWQRASATDRAFAEPFRTAVRCALHKWHIHGSPAQHDCQEQLAELVGSVPLDEEWWSRFGGRSADVLRATDRVAKRRSLSGSDAWEVLGHLPRYADDADHALELLRTVETPKCYRRSTPAPTHLLGATISLAMTNTAASNRRRDFQAARDLHDHLKREGIDWLGIARLWTKRRWPSNHLFYHRVAIRTLAREGKRKALSPERSRHSSRSGRVPGPDQTRSLVTNRVTGLELIDVPRSRNRTCMMAIRTRGPHSGPGTPAHLYQESCRSLARSRAMTSGSDQTAPPAFTPALLNIDEAADYLNVPRRWVADAVRQRRIRCTRIGKHVRFRIEHLDELVAACEQAVTAPAEASVLGPRPKGSSRSRL